MARSGVDFAELIGTVDTPVIRKSFSFSRQQSQISQTLSIRSISTESLDSFSEFQGETEIEANPECAPMEASSKGKVKGSLILNYLNSGANWFVMFMLGMIFVSVQLLASGADYFVSIWYVFHLFNDRNHLIKSSQ